MINIYGSVLLHRKHFLIIVRATVYGRADARLIMNSGGPLSSGLEKEREKGGGGIVWWLSHLHNGSHSLSLGPLVAASLLFPYLPPAIGERSEGALNSPLYIHGHLSPYSRPGPTLPAPSSKSLSELPHECDRVALCEPKLDSIPIADCFLLGRGLSRPERI